MVHILTIFLRRVILIPLGLVHKTDYYKFTKLELCCFRHRMYTATSHPGDLGKERASFMSDVTIPASVVTTG